MLNPSYKFFFSAKLKLQNLIAYTKSKSLNSQSKWNNIDIVTPYRLLPIAFVNINRFPKPILIGLFVCTSYWTDILNSPLINYLLLNPFDLYKSGILSRNNRVVKIQNTFSVENWKRFTPNILKYGHYHFQFFHF